MIRMSFVFIFAGSALAAEPEPAKTPKEKLETLRAEAKKSEEDYRKAMDALPDTPEGEKDADKLWKDYDKANGERYSAALELAKADPKSDAAMEALEWVLTTPRSYYLPVGVPAIKFATEHLAANPKIGKLAATLGHYAPLEKAEAHEPALELLRAIQAKNSDRTARGQAAMGLAKQALDKFGYAEYKKQPDTEEKAKAAEAAFEAILKDYGDCRWLRRDTGTLGEKATRELFELRHLRIGKTIPALEGEDLDGKKFSTDEAKGKVRIIVFWASWCGPCMQMVPDEVKLCERMKGRDFTIIGINGDDDPAKAKKVMQEKGMTWRSIWNGKEGPRGAITDSWNVYSWPTVYVVDSKGVIRYKGLRHKELDDAVEALVAEHEKAKVAK